MKKKRLFYIVVTLALTTVTLTACDSTSPTQENLSPPKSVVFSSKSESEILSNYLSEQASKPSHFIASGGATVQQPFSLNPEFVHIKLLMKNNSSHEVNVSLTHLDTNRVYLSRTIAPGESLDWINVKEGYSEGMSTGDYLLQWSGGGYRVDGEVWGSACSELDDVVDLSY
ncbi:MULTISPECIES: pilus assembly protein [unclassified Paenibacillus]|uniref:pilus assembly protein n=1 Tax=unclassified Paenibacillus TaxID=185978 RepID=UPI0011B046D8|nr:MULTISPECIES: pilus assembly protein [unclassified Paenibacillus]MBD8839132.1 pilus assembly protein [Paenibacillus sp. CFBP 13594]QZN75695.1 pilus assembly protein [Paenibacillus sp. DR312]